MKTTKRIIFCIVALATTTFAGVRIGDSPDRVCSEFGRPSARYSSGSRLVMTFTTGEVEFYRGRAVRISLSPACPPRYREVTASNYRSAPWVSPSSRCSDGGYIVQSWTPYPAPVYVVTPLPRPDRCAPPPPRYNNYRRYSPVISTRIENGPSSARNYVHPSQNGLSEGRWSSAAFR